MKRSSSWLLSSSRLLASAFEHPSHKPWRISHRQTYHPSTPPPSPIQSRSVTCPPSNESPIDTWPSSPSLSRHGTWKVLPKLMHPFNGSMSPLFLEKPTPHNALDQHPHALAKKHGPPNTSPLASMPLWLQKEVATFGNKDGNDLLQVRHINHSDDKDVNDHMQVLHMRRLLRLTQLDALKERLKKEAHEVMTYNELLSLCSSLGVVSTPKEATLLVKHLDDAGFIFIFQDTVYLKPNKIARLMKEVMPQPPATLKEREHIVDEMSRLEQEKHEIDKRAYDHSRKVLWLGFGYLMVQMALIFHLTFWELSWDVMEPICYFVTNITLLVGYVFFMITSKHPTYKDLSSLLISSKQKRLMKARKFDVARLLELQKQYGSSPTSFLRSTT